MPGKVLIVDDIEFNIKLIEVKLRKELYVIFNARDGLEAIEIAKQEMPDVIIMDVMMPRKNGIDATRELKQIPETSHIPIVMLTALNSIQDKLQGLEAGADDFISKPINEKILITRVKSLVRYKMMMDEVIMRHKTGEQLGFVNQPVLADIKDVSGSKVLIVDDDIINVRRITTALNDNGIDTFTTEDSDEAMKLLKEKEIDCIIVNTNMLDVNGLALCSSMRSNPEYRRTIFIVILSEEDEEQFTKGLEMGINDYIFAPVEPNEMVARVQMQLKRKKYIETLKKSFEDSVSLSYKDELTQLFNRRFFNAHFPSILQKSAARGQNTSIIFIDIDHFKKKNDTYGHMIGDQIIQHVCAEMLIDVRETDLCVRFGGEEFLIILPGTDNPGLRIVAERLCKRIENAIFETEGQTIPVTVSVGGATFVTEETQENFIQRADEALYKAKNTGRNKVCYAEDE